MVAVFLVCGPPVGCLRAVRCCVHHALADGVALAWKLRGGKFVWGRVYQDAAEALEDAGIE